MIRKADRDEITADLATVESLLASVPEGDVLGRRSLKARRDTIAQELALLTAQAQSSAQPADVTSDLDPSCEVAAVVVAAERTQGR